MKFNEAWLREWINPEVATAEFAHRLTMAGLEVDAIDPVAADFTGVIVGEIVSIAQHPDADKLRVCQVSNGNETVQVVCGAANARQGLKIPFATLGAQLPGLKIKQAKLRGVESFGMLCSAEELGLAESADGLLELPADAPVGQDIRVYLQLDDTAIELGVTPNRADCLSIRGLARDAAAVFSLSQSAPTFNAVAPQIEDQFPVYIEATDVCPRYLGRVIRGVNLTQDSPLWLKERLRRCGQRSIDPVVDITNYVLLELGQPLHAFDLNKLKGGIVVRKAKQGEKLALLNDQTVELKDDTLVIADEEKPLAMAGIMGGAESAVSHSTQDIFLESAFFAPIKQAGKARNYGLHTDSSHRYERGVDYQLQRQAIERATQLILDVCGGAPGPVIEKVSETDLPQAKVITLRRQKVAEMLGVAVADSEIERIFTQLEFSFVATTEGWQVTAPSWRFDLSIEVDLIEEIARIYGYNQLPTRHTPAGIALKPQSETRKPLAQMRRILLSRGYQEAITYSFVDPELQKLINPDIAPVPVKNPISSDMSVMRTSLWAGLLKTLQHNLNRQQSRVRLFETGLRFVPSAEGLQQERMFAGLVTGDRYPESWSEQGEKVDFFDLKGDLEAFLAYAGVEVAFDVGSHSALHPGQTAVLRIDGKEIGYIGSLHPQLQAQLDIPQSVYVFEFSLNAINEGRLPKFEELSRFPEVRRDLAVLVDKNVNAGDVMQTIREVAGETLRNLRLFDTYEGKGIDPQRKSLGFGLTFRHSSRTLNDDEIAAILSQVIELLNKRYQAVLRA